MTSARAVALQVTEQIRKNDGFANLVLPNAIRQAKLDGRDAGHATDITYGMQRWRRYLDAILSDCVTGSLRRVDAGVLDLLRLATYELTLRQEPSHVINEWVNLAKRRFRRATGFVNATLRAIAGRRPDEWRDRVATLHEGSGGEGVRWSHPDWMVAEFHTLLDANEVVDLLRADNEPTAPRLIALPGRATIPDNAIRTEFSPYGFVSPGGSLENLVGVTEGSVRPQDEGSQLAALALIAAAPLRAGERWLDLCAGPGGKSAVLAAFAVPADIALTANEVQPHRAELVRRSLRLFTSGVTVDTTDGREFCAKHPSSCDRVLVDAPCSGVGALRRRPESRWRKHPSDIDELVPLQRELLDAGISATVVGGIVAYVTCSPLTAETEDVVSAVLSGRDDVEVIDTTAVIHSVAPTLERATRGTAVQLWPHRHETDAMFIQLIRRTR